VIWNRRQQLPHQASTWQQSSGGEVLDEVEFVGVDERVFAATCMPGLDRARSEVGVVICPSIGHELIKNYRREVLMGRALARAGVPTARLQYRGSGNSDGCAEAMDRTSMRDDVMLVADHLRSRSAVTRTLLLGTRFGSLVAASAATALGGAPVACLSPVLSASDYVREGFRAKRMQDVGNRRSGAAPSDPMTELERTGWVDVLGSPIYKSFCDSWADTTLADELSVPDRVLLAHMGGRPKLSALRALADELDGRSFTTAVVEVEADESWWYLDERQLMQLGAERQPAPPAGTPAARSAIEQVVEWVTSTVPVH
jgi:pimeloyl-ACP methyl ester carboxylesterase